MPTSDGLVTCRDPRKAEARVTCSRCTMSFRLLEALPKGYGQICVCPECHRRFHHCSSAATDKVVCSVERRFYFDKEGKWL